MKKVVSVVAFVTSCVVSSLLVACGKDEPKVVVVPEDPKVNKPASTQMGGGPAASTAAPAAIEPWMEPATLCEHTVKVCEDNEQCRTRKAKLNAAGIRAYQLFDVECVKWVTKRQTVLGATYPACAACLRDAAAPQAVQDCMFKDGPCHGENNPLDKK